MPVNYGEIAAFHHEQAARHYALAQAARDRGSLADAEYQAGQAARWEEAAQEQKIEMRQQPACSVARRKPHCRPLQPPPMPIAIVCLFAVVRCVKRIAAAILQLTARRSAPVDGLSLD